MDFATFFPDLLTIQVIALPVLVMWVIVETFFDFKNRNIPLIFSFVPLITGLVFLFFFVDKILAVSLLLLVAVSNLKPSTRVPITVLFCVVAFFMINDLSKPVLIGYFIFFTFFQIGIIGGADALAGTYLLCWFPSWGNLFVIFVVLFLFSVIVLLVKHKSGILSAITNTISGKEGTRYPAMIAFSSSLVVFSLITLISS